ncbi:alpha/beta hydrolase family protein [Altererythrobacter lauratis]|uniref:Alpha/beta hydrolase family protein n=1 Tax=Alteraurantiacibacter lauratis TaxID=2054627 RepID=A0ABV7EDN6_9SPHN
MRAVRRFLAGAAALTMVTAFPPMAAGQDGDADGAQAEAFAALPAPFPVAAFTARAMLQGTQISPDGSKIAYLTQQGGNTYVLVRDAETLEMVGGSNLGTDIDTNWFRWAGNSGFLLSVNGTTRLVGEEVAFSRLFHLPLAGDSPRPLVLERQDLDGDDLIFTDPEGRYALVSIAERLWSPPSVWRFDLEDPAARPVEVQRAHASVSSWFADEQGVVRVGVGYSPARRMEMRYRPDAQSEWRVSARVGRDSRELKEWGFVGLRAGSDEGYAFSVPEGENHAVLRSFNFATAEPGEIVHRVDGADISAVGLSPERSLVALYYEGDVEQTRWLEPDLARHHAALQAALPGSRVDIISWASTDRLLVLQHGADDPGALYVFTPAQRRLNLVGDLRPDLPPDALGRSRAFTYTARDGTQIRAMLTLPPGEGDGPYPLIVNPHGGPYGVRDRLDFDDEAQLLANRGYAVVRPNFRGSGGYGHAFEQLGDGQIGRAMQDDLDDVVHHLVAEGVAAAGRVCLVGGSYGGYAALWGVIRNPEIYRCAASWAGVTHFNRQLAYDRNYLSTTTAGLREWRRQVQGDSADFNLDQVSPAVQAARLTRPILLAHGRKDSRVPFTQFEVMRSRARSSSAPVETLVFDEAGHGFNKPEDRQTYLSTLVDFLQRHNPPDLR